MPLSVKADIAQRKASGNFFRKNVSKTVMGNTLDMVEWLVGEGEKLYRAGLPVDKDFTRGHIHGFAYQTTRLVTGARVQSRFGKVHLGRRGETVSRPVSPGTKDLKKYGPERRPYVTLWTLETGRHGASNRKAWRARRKAFNRLRQYERTIRRDLAEGLH